MLIAPASRDVKCNLWLRLFCPLNCGKGTESASGLSFLYPWSHRKLWAPPRPRWLWTGTSVRLCCPCWPAAPPSLPALRTTHNWSTPLCRPSIGCAKDARSPKPRGTPSRSVCWLSASEAHFAHTLSFLLHSVYCIILSIPGAAIFLSLGHFSTFFLFYRHLRPTMMQQLLRRLVFDVPLLSEYCKIPLRVRQWKCIYTIRQSCCYSHNRHLVIFTY